VDSRFILISSMQTDKTATFLIVHPIRWWHVLLPFVVMALTSLVATSWLIMGMAGVLSGAALVSIPARLVIDADRFQVTWLGSPRINAEWADVSATYPFWLGGGTWIELKSGRRILLTRSLNTKIRAAELHDAIRQHLHLTETS
jgi:hypothetical protein